MALTPDQIKAIYAKRRTKGLYTELLAQFLASGENGISVREQWPEQFSWDATLVGVKLPDGTDANPGKQATTLKQGFENAKDRKDAPEGSEQVDVIVDGEDVYLLNTATFATVADDIEPDEVEVAVEATEPVEVAVQ